MPDLILASQSSVRASLLRNAGLQIETVSARVDEAAIKASLIAEGVSHRDIADSLAEAKARKISSSSPDMIVLGCDQVLSFGDRIFSKPKDKEAARQQIAVLSGRTHHLYTAAVVYEGGEPLWRHVTTSKMTMRDIGDAYISDYLDRNWPDIGQSVGGYMLEREGVRLFQRIEGDHFHILGLPLIELLSWLTARGTLQG